MQSLSVYPCLRVIWSLVFIRLSEISLTQKSLTSTGLMIGFWCDVGDDAILEKNQGLRHRFESLLRPEAKAGSMLPQACPWTISATGRGQWHTTEAGRGLSGLHSHSRGPATFSCRSESCSPQIPKPHNNIMCSRCPQLPAWKAWSKAVLRLTGVPKGASVDQRPNPRDLHGQIQSRDMLFERRGIYHQHSEFRFFEMIWICVFS